MPASIFGERFMGRREAAWHNLGTVFPADAKISPAEAVLRCGGDFHVQKYPLVAHLPTGTIASDKVAIVRHPTHDDGSYHVLGYAGKDYEVVQNIELGFMLERLAEEWPLETVGVLGNGETIFLTLDAGSASVAGEEVRQYFLLANSHTGGKSLKVALTPVRVVCQNTLIAGSNAASIMSMLPHTMNVRAEVNFRIDLIANMRRGQQRLLESFDAMARTKLSKEEGLEIINASYPMPNRPKRAMLGDLVINDEALKGSIQDDKRFALAALQGAKTVQDEYEYQLKRVQVHRDGALEQTQLVFEENPVIANTAWAYWQGVTATENWKNGDPKNPKGTSESILFGDRAAVMARGYTRAMTLVEAHAN